MVERVLREPQYLDFMDLPALFRPSEVHGGSGFWSRLSRFPVA